MNRGDSLEKYTVCSIAPCIWENRGRKENGHNEKKGGGLGWLIRKRKKETLMHF